MIWTKRQIQNDYIFAYVGMRLMGEGVFISRATSRFLKKINHARS